MSKSPTTTLTPEDVVELYKSLVDSLSQKELMNKSNFEQMVDLRKVVKNKKIVLSRSSKIEKFNVTKEYHENLGFIRNKSSSFHHRQLFLGMEERCNKIRQGVAPIPEDKVFQPAFPSFEIAKLRKLLEKLQEFVTMMMPEKDGEVKERAKVADKMMTEMKLFLKTTEEEIIPTGSEGLTERMKNTVLIRLTAEPHGQNEVEFYDGGRHSLVSRGPYADPLAEADSKKLIGDWLSNLLVPRLRQWSKEARRSMPKCLRELTSVIGVDLEKFHVHGEEKGPCSVCGRTAKSGCPDQKIQMLHFKVGSGYLVTVSYTHLTLPTKA